MIRKTLAASLLVTACLGACHKKSTPEARSQPGDTPVTPAAGKAPAQPPVAMKDQSAADLAEVLVTIDGEKVTVGDFQARLNAQTPYERARYTSLEQKKAFLDDWVRFEVLAREAKRRGLDQDPEIVATMKREMIQKLLQSEFENRVKPEEITEPELKKYYDDHFAEFNKPEEVRASAVIVKSKDLALKVQAEAKALPPQDNVAFRELVEKYSEDGDSRARAGDLRFFSADSKDPPAAVITAAFKLQSLGDLAGPIETDRGFYVIKQTGRRPALAEPYEKVKRQIQNRLYREKRNQAVDAYIADLKTKAKVDVRPDALAKVRVDTTPPPPMPQPGEPPAEAPR